MLFFIMVTTTMTMTAAHHHKREKIRGRHTLSIFQILIFPVDTFAGSVVVRHGKQTGCQLSARHNSIL